MIRVGAKAYLIFDVETPTASLRRGSLVNIVARVGPAYVVQDIYYKIHKGIHANWLSETSTGHRLLRCVWCSRKEGVAFADEDGDPTCGHCAVKGTVSVVGRYGEVQITRMDPHWVFYECRCGKKGKIIREGLTSLFHCRHAPDERS